MQYKLIHTLAPSCGRISTTPSPSLHKAVKSILWDHRSSPRIPGVLCKIPRDVLLHQREILPRSDYV